MPRNRPQRSTERSVALLVETSNRYSREPLHGIRAYMRETGKWAVHLTEQGRGDIPPPWLRRWKGHGIIARIENKRIESAARETGVPVVSVSGKFQQHVKRSPYEMIQTVRFQHAQELLLRSDKSVADIAQYCGFLTPEYFSATFKKRAGMSPRAYRQRSQLKGDLQGREMA